MVVYSVMGLYDFLNRGSCSETWDDRVMLGMVLYVCMYVFIALALKWSLRKSFPQIHWAGLLLSQA